MPRSSSSPPFHLHRQFIHLHPSLMFLLLNILFSSFDISPSLTSKAQEAGISPARRGDANNSTQDFTFNVAMLLRFVLPPVVKPFATGVASGVLGLQAKLLVTVALLLVRWPGCHLLKVAFLLVRWPGCHLGLANSPAVRLHRFSQKNLHLVRLPSRPGHLVAKPNFGQVFVLFFLSNPPMLDKYLHRIEGDTFNAMCQQPTDQILLFTFSL